MLIRTDTSYSVRRGPHRPRIRRQRSSVRLSPLPNILLTNTSTSLARSLARPPASSALYQHFFDQLLRALLDLPSSPALIILGAWAPAVALDQGYADPQLVHAPIAMYYDIPYVSLKRAVWESYLRWPRSVRAAFWVEDGLHPNVRGHVSCGPRWWWH